MFELYSMRTNINYNLVFVAIIVFKVSEIHAERSLKNSLDASNQLHIIKKRFVSSVANTKKNKKNKKKKKPLNSCKNPTNKGFS